MRTVTLFLLAAALAFAADITGKWRFTVETEMGSGTPTFVLKQDGEKVSGTYSGQLGEAPVAGTVKGDNVELQLEVAPQGDKIVVKYSGTLDGDDKMKGSVEFGSLGKGTFTAERDK
jgi:hypothetical protein